MPKVLVDVLERTLAAYLTTFLGLLLADGFDLTDVSALKAAAIAAVPAALSVIKGAIGTRFGDRTSAAWLPGRKSSGGTGGKGTGKRTSGTSAASAKKAAGAKTPAKKTPAGRTPAKKTTTRKAAAKDARKAPVKDAETAPVKDAQTPPAAKAPAKKTSSPAPTEETPQ
ncbi:holin [Streptomyces albireticuli]|uniref:Holin n=1 Tax=Streptomyces albireticuli TaxID=1940 RepID=A0A2A2DA16_9ACTN|nr:holin [Streptomyces albireticuli]MCD9143202.1 holin [Streptomyces albireticuli]MCD9163644.1 holin [Streptomyces albireticuli]MCD9191319.1 holin [Streptomyces albireticuli]PAU48152.1 hypothetical protein CK936_14890 [Streptomyces albireticuli]